MAVEYFILLSSLRKFPLQIYVHTSVFIMLFIIFLYGCSSCSQRIRYSPEISSKKILPPASNTHSLQRDGQENLCITSVCICYDSVIHGGIDFVVYIPYTYFSSRGTHKYISFKLLISSNLTEFVPFLL